jgi:hypothetical protein
MGIDPKKVTNPSEKGNNALYLDAPVDLERLFETGDADAQLC